MSDPLFHGLLQTGYSTIFVRRKISRHERLRPPRPVAALVGNDRGQKGRRSLNSHTDVERPPAVPELHPGMKLTQAQGFLGLRDRGAADAGEDEFVPELVELCELGIFPRLFTS